MKNPYLNALAAVLYISIIVTGLQMTERVDTPDPVTPLLPMAMLSLLVFSVALMGFLFFWNPVMLFIDGDRVGATKFFLKTLGTFGVCMVILFTALYSIYM